MSLKGKIALVTGSARGLGKVFAIALASAGATVVVHYHRNRRTAVKTLREVRAYAPQSMLVSGDVTKPRDVERMIRTIDRTFGRLDILINNVGNFVVKPMKQWTDEEFRDVMESNLNSVWYLTRAVLPLMRRKKFGRVITIGCAGCERMVVRENTTPYYIAKHGVVSLTKHWARFEKTPGVTFNALLPGVLETSEFLPKGVKKSQIVPLSEVVMAGMKLIRGKQNGALVTISRGWKP